MIRIGTAAWSTPNTVAASFPGDGGHLARYARVLGCVEINTTFSRVHRATTFERWTTETLPDFRFSAKFPRGMTHDARLNVPHVRR